MKKDRQFIWDDDCEFNGGSNNKMDKQQQLEI